MSKLTKEEIKLIKLDAKNLGLIFLIIFVFIMILLLIYQIIK
jgi:hypothetical protein